MLGTNSTNNVVIQAVIQAEENWNKIKWKLQCQVHHLDESVMYGQQPRGVFDS